ncbi:hypothetical protein CV770_34390 [Bradyrhizobium sp. AC87j1]|nr:hypothetical protein CV770_34390 [Bradyrhizobium sp. AC87j1]
MREVLRAIPQVRRLNYRARRFLRGARGEGDETEILSGLVAKESAPRTFVEFGFHPVAFNCAAFAYNPNWQGLLIDGSADQVQDAKVLLPKWLDIRNCFISLNNLDFIREKFAALGILSIDVDGNDYWFLEQLIGVNPSVISVEYNASFGPNSVTVPYDPGFSRLQKHASGWYHGASLTALAKLCSRTGYGLAAVSSYGANAFFTRSGNLDPLTAWRPNLARDRWSGISAEHQWKAIRDLPLQSV